MTTNTTRETKQTVIIIQNIYIESALVFYFVILPGVSPIIDNITFD
jgi:hypothetical protein